MRMIMGDWGTLHQLSPSAIANTQRRNTRLSYSSEEGVYISKLDCYSENFLLAAILVMRGRSRFK